MAAWRLRAHLSMVHKCHRHGYASSSEEDVTILQCCLQPCSLPMFATATLRAMENDSGLRSILSVAEHDVGIAATSGCRHRHRPHLLHYACL